MKVGIIHMQEPLTVEFCKNFLAQGFDEIVFADGKAPEFTPKPARDYTPVSAKVWDKNRQRQKRRRRRRK